MVEEQLPHGGPKESGDLDFRPFSSREDYEACTDLQEEVWGRGFSEKVSAAILMIANRLGGLAAGAFDENGTLQGFVFGLTGIMDGKLVHWSDMLAVRREGRDLGLGTRLKRYQREVLLGRGVVEMRWTFDPLQARNARLNFSKLGIVCREYVENMYGETGSPLHRGVGTDRLVAIWELESEGVRSKLAQMGKTPSVHEEEGAGWGLGIRPPEVIRVLDGEPFPAPASAILGLDGPQLLLPIPGTVDDMMERDLPLAILWREATRQAFSHYFSRGYQARDFIRDEAVSFYVLVGPGGDKGGSGGGLP